ncbi:unnamed protein product [Medioppia subpectinata]|uniref:Uncharacterized protein n=1 Tax=Medioppia subpectinata TaxID=1979941 RepID=A0A7R9Q7D6_9ACAR|nr:unnamed protein product [Medioppia subpectinata]CAG2115453.1 unnamed protein product [Medioppia subpectinata]
MRGYLDQVVSKYAKTGDIIICSDVDEIPSEETVQLLRDCTGFSNNMHLQLNMYLYSFEYFYSTDDSWRAHISIYDNNFHYRHGRLSDHLLADAGWHCSFCFRNISDFIFKMTSYSHNDRVMDEKLLLKEEIQKKICNGEDVYDMYPEVYSFRELVLKFGAIPKSKTMTNLPKHLMRNPTKFAFLLPNGCVREDYNQTISLKKV